MSSITKMETLSWKHCTQIKTLPLFVCLLLVCGVFLGELECATTPKGFKKCPVKGCRSKPQQRLADHIRLCHPDIKPQRRRQLCKLGKRVPSSFMRPQPGQRKLSMHFFYPASHVMFLANEQLEDPIKYHILLELLL